MVATVQDLLLHLYDPDTKSFRITVQNSFTSTNNFEITVLNTSTLVINSNPYRKYMLLVNVSDEIIYLMLGSNAELNKGIPLLPYGSYEITILNLYTGIITAISQNNDKRLLCVEA